MYSLCEMCTPNISEGLKYCGDQRPCSLNQLHCFLKPFKHTFERLELMLRSIFDLMGPKRKLIFTNLEKDLISRLVVYQNFSKFILSSLNCLNTHAIASKQPNALGSPGASEHDEDTAVFRLLCFSVCHVLI